MSDSDPRFLSKKREPVRYRQVVDLVAAGCGFDLPEPHLVLPLDRLQVIADQFVGGIEWLPTVDLRLTRPDTTETVEVINFVSSLLPAGRLPLASGFFEVDCDGSLSSVRPVIHFFDERFLTVGVLFHELAHLHDLSADHGEKFYHALVVLQNKWNDTFAGNCLPKVSGASLLSTGLRLMRERLADCYRWPI